MLSVVEAPGIKSSLFLLVNINLFVSEYLVDAAVMILVYIVIM